MIHGIFDEPYALVHLRGREAILVEALVVAPARLFVRIQSASKHSFLHRPTSSTTHIRRVPDFQLRAIDRRDVCKDLSDLSRAHPMSYVSSAKTAATTWPRTKQDLTAQAAAAPRPHGTPTYRPAPSSSRSPRPPSARLAYDHTSQPKSRRER